MLCGQFGNARDWRDGGFDQDYRNTIPGLNYRMTNMQAAVGLAQIERFDSLLERRLRNASIYSKNLRGRGKWLFVAEVNNPREVGRKLLERGIQTRPVFTPLHRSPAFRQYAKGNYKASDAFWERGICLPTGPHVSPQQAELISEAVLECSAELV